MIWGNGKRHDNAGNGPDGSDAILCQRIPSIYSLCFEICAYRSANRILSTLPNCMVVCLAGWGRMLVQCAAMAGKDTMEIYEDY